MSDGNPYLRRPAPPARGGGPDGLADVLERVLDKGLVIAGDIQINLLDIELLTIKVRLLLASADTAQQMGIDWWQHDPFLSGRDRELAQENAVLRERVDQLEATLGAKLAPGEPSPGDLVGEEGGSSPTRGQLEPTGAQGGGASAPPPSAEADELRLSPAGDAERLDISGDPTDEVRVRAAGPDRSSRTNEELREELRQRGLPVSGTKAELLARLEGDGS